VITPTRSYSSIFLQAGNTFGVVTYTYPNVSAKVIPAFVKVVTANV
jgi:hypothetical protein